MSKHIPEQAPTEEFAKQFQLAGPSKALKQEVLASARSTWLTHTDNEVRSGSLAPYFAAIAATWLTIITINVLGIHAVKTRQSQHIVTIQPCQISEMMDEGMCAGSPYRHSMALRIVGLSHAGYKTYYHQLKTLLSQGGSL